MEERDDADAPALELGGLVRADAFQDLADMCATVTAWPERHARPKKGRILSCGLKA